MLEVLELRCSVKILAEIMHVAWKIKFRVCHALSLLTEHLPSPHYRFVSLAETFNMAATNLWELFHTHLAKSVANRTTHYSGDKFS